MAATYEPIATTTISTPTTSYLFSSIPATYTDLILVQFARVSTVNNSSYLNFNGVTTGGISSNTILYGNGNATSPSFASVRFSNDNRLFTDYYGIPDANTSNFNTVITHIMNYSNTTTYKTILSRGNNATSGGTDFIVGTWRSTAAINSINIIQPTYNFQSGTTFTLYGIKAA